MKNAQLWKRILNEGVEGSEKEAAVADLIVTAPIIVDKRPRESGFAWDDLPAVAIPFPRTWIEGHFLQDREDICLGGLVQDIGKELPAVFDSPEFRNVTGDRKVAILVLIGDSRFKPAKCGSMVLGLNDRGIIQTNRVLIATPNLVQIHRNQRRAMDWLDGVCHMFMDTLGLLSCQNVSLAPRDNDPQQVRRAIKRHGGNPDSYRYHVLVVRPAGAKSDAPAQEIGIMPRHVCRGHHQHYGPATAHGHRDGRDRGLLFGKYAGRFYVPQTYKGDKKNGIVEKDYEVPA